MEALFEVLAKMLGTFKDPTQVVLLLVCVAEGAFIWITRKEDREDKRAVVEALSKVNETLGKLGNIMSANSGRAL